MGKYTQGKRAGWVQREKQTDIPKKSERAGYREKKQMDIPKKSEWLGDREKKQVNIPKEKKTAGYREVKETNNTPGAEATEVLCLGMGDSNCQAYELFLREGIPAILE